MNPRAIQMEKRLEIPVIFASLLTVPALLLEDSSSHGTWHSVGYFGGLALWLVFVVEVVAMLAVVDSRSQWLREHPLDVAIVLLTPPFLLSAVQGLRVLRVLRLLRLFRLARIARRLFTTEGLRYFALLTVIALFISAEAFASVEKVSFGDALYWALATMTTVGYGDVTAHTTSGKIIACVAMVFGIVFFAILTGAIAQQFLASRVTELEAEERDLIGQIRDISDQLRRLEEQALRQSRRATPEP